MKAGRVWLSLPGQLLAWGYLLLFPLIGLIVSYIGFCDPDTCWHLALGRWISLHHQLPVSDPFSTNVSAFVSVAPGQPLIQHEWLADWIFFQLFSIGGAKLLLVFTAILSAFSLAILPAFLMTKNCMPRLAALGLLVPAVPACLFRLWVRPEVISFSCLSLLVCLVELAQTAPKKRYRLCLAFTFAVMAVWANCHALFVVGIFYLLIYACGSLMTRSLPQRIISLLAAGLAGTLCTPWHFNLWLLILKIITSPQAHANKENGPLDYMALGHFTVIPLMVSFAVAAAYLVKTAGSKKAGGDKNSLALPALIQPLGLFLSALVLAIAFRRLTPFALIILFASQAVLFRQIACLRQTGTDDAQRPDNGSWYECASKVVDDLKIPGRSSTILGLLFCAVSTWLACTYLVAADIPSASRFFTPACQALAFLSKERPRGRMLNDSRIGSMMTFCLSNPPDLFIDGRFDSYSRRLIDDYQQMRMARPGYSRLLTCYKIDWLIFPPGTPIIEQLIVDPGWQIIYRDGAAVVLSKKMR